MKIQNIWRVLSLVVALFAALSLTFTPALAPNFNLTPVYAEDDDDDRRDRRACPCWTKKEADRAVRAAFAEVGSENFVCDSDIDVREPDKRTGADFVVVGDAGRELDLEATLLIDDGEVLRASCSVEVNDEVVVRELTEAQAVECVRILGKICLKNLKKKRKKKGK